MAVRNGKGVVRVPSSSIAGRRNHDETRDGDKGFFKFRRLTKRLIQPVSREAVFPVRVLTERDLDDLIDRLRAAEFIGRKVTR